MKRLFFALWPSEKVRQRCAELARTVSTSGERKVRPDNLHMTLVFLGSVNEEIEAGILSAVSTIPAPKLAITFDQLSYWRRPQILCLSGRAADASLNRLVDQLNEAAQAFNIPIDKRPYVPHVTLVRKAKAPRTVPFEPITWQSDSFCLVESCSGPGGVEYRIIQEWRNPDKGN